LFKVNYLENTWTYKKKLLVRAEKLYTAQNYQNFLEAFRKHFPSYVYFCPYRAKEVLSVPLDDIDEVYVPRECLQRLIQSEAKDSLKDTTLELVSLLSANSGISLKDFGVHGSVALDMHTPKSDIDLVVYGGRNFRALEAAILKLVNNGAVEYVCGNRLDAARRYKGKYRGRVFMYNAIRKTDETVPAYGACRYSPIKPLKFRCIVKDDEEAMFRPATYTIEGYTPSDAHSTLTHEEMPDRAVSMVGCYRNVARQGDTIDVSGTLERVDHIETGEVFYQVVVGTGVNEDEHVWPTRC